MFLDQEMDTSMVGSEALAAQLARVLSSNTFRRAERSTALLGYLVKQFLEGHGDRLKEYTLGAEGLGRGPSFDPRTDPIVRAEASRLRTRLEQYYRTEGAADPVVISLPKGSYVPHVTPRAALDVEPPPGTETARFIQFRNPLAATLIAVLLLLAVFASSLATGLWKAPASGAADSAIHQFEVELRTDGMLGSEVGPDVVLSRDGTRVVFVSRDAGGVPHLYTHRWAQPEVSRLPGTEGARDPFVSPDGRWVGFWADGSLRKIAVDGGAPVVLCDSPGSTGASWGEDNTIVFGISSTHTLWQVRGESGRREPLLDLTVESASPVWPQILPGGEYVLYTVMTAAGADQATIEVLATRTQKRTVVHRGGTYGRYLASGHLTYVNQGTLYAIRFDPRRGALDGDAVPVRQDVSYSQTFGYAQMDVSRDGTLVYRRGAESGPLVAQWLDRAGAASPLVAKPGRYGWPRLSADGRLAFVATEGGTTTIRIQDTRTGETQRFSSGAGEYGGLMWWPNRNRLVLAGSTGMTWVDLEQPEHARSLTTSRSMQVPWSVSPDASQLAFYEMNPDTGFDLWTVPVATTNSEFKPGTPERFLGTPAMEVYPAFSPDGRWIAYASNVSGSYEVYVRRFPVDNTKEVRVSTGGGSIPSWSVSGQDIVYRTDRQRVVLTSYRIEGNAFLIGATRAWPSPPLADTGVLANFDLAPDGQHIAALMPAIPDSDRQTQNHVTVVLNFFEDLRRRASAR